MFDLEQTPPFFFNGQQLDLKEGVLEVEKYIICGEEDYTNIGKEVLNTGKNLEEQTSQTLSIKGQVEESLEANFNWEKHIFEECFDTKKNNNFISFLISSFLENYRNFLPTNKKQYQAWMKKTQRALKAESKIKNTLKHLRLIFSGTDSCFKMSRKILHLMVKSKDFKREIVHSKRIKKYSDKKHNLYCSKIFAMRCISSKLTQRIQSKD